MKEYYFYCPNCNAEYVARSLPTGTVPNLRDGYGTHIHHYECPRCHNLDAGYMLFGLGKMNELPRKEQSISSTSSVCTKTFAALNVPVSRSYLLWIQPNRLKH